jgi:hypothetical protein
MSEIGEEDVESFIGIVAGELQMTDRREADAGGKGAGFLGGGETISRRGGLLLLRALERTGLSSRALACATEDTGLDKLVCTCGRVGRVRLRAGTIGLSSASIIGFLGSTSIDIGDCTTGGRSTSLIFGEAGP